MSRFPIVTSTMLALMATPVLADALFSRAGELWPNDYLHFFSEDMRSVRVTLRRDMFTNDGEQITISLPRAWITFASDYDPLKLKELPDAIETKSLGLRMADSDEAAFSIRSRELARAEGISWSEALRRLRADEYNVMLGYVPARIATDHLQYGLLVNREKIVDRDELRYDPSSNTYLGQVGQDGFLTARCRYTPNPITFCHYFTRLGANLTLQADFLDFRFHGGKAYANRRMSALIAAICGQIQGACDAKNTSGASGN